MVVGHMWKFWGLRLLEFAMDRKRVTHYRLIPCARALFSSLTEVQIFLSSGYDLRLVSQCTRAARSAAAALSFDGPFLTDGGRRLALMPRRVPTVKNVEIDAKNAAV